MRNLRKVILYIAMSLDGYIARKNGDVDWLAGDGSDPDADIKYDEFYSAVDTVIMGKKTYDQILTFGDYPYKDTKGYVYSSSKIGSDDNVEFTDKDPALLVEGLRKNSGKDIWLIGGSDLAAKFIEEGIVDEYYICIIPVILGEGIRLFKEGISTIDLKLVSSESVNGLVLLRYVKRMVGLEF